MAAPAFLAQPTIQRIPPLIEEVRKHQIVVPRFQRPFVWTDEQRVELMRSIYAGLPIGSLMVWRTKLHSDLAVYRLPGCGLGESDAGGVRQFLLDGHQRVTTLVTALMTEPEDSGDDDVARDYGDLKAIYFDLEAGDDGDADGFVLERIRPKPPATWLPLSILFDSYSLHEFQSRLVEEGHSREVVNRTDNVVSRFKDYLVPVVPIVTDEIEIATKSFQRVNSAGTKMSEVHMASALAFSQFNLNEKIATIKDTLRDEGWYDLDEQRVLDTCKSILGLEIRMRTLTNLVKQLREDESVLDRAQHALTSAARFLRRRCGIFGPQTLPYSFQIVLLAAALEKLTDDPDDDEHDDVLFDWLWATTYTEYFAGISGTGLRRAREHLIEVVESGRFTLPSDLNPRVSAPARFDFRSARTRAIALSMAEMLPVDIKGHQRETFDLLAEHGANAVGLLFTREELDGDRPLAESVENRILGEPKQLNRVNDAIRRLVFDGAGMASHGFDRQACSALRQEDYRGALARRRAYLIDWDRSYIERLGLSYEDE